jgi:hypothetical protein
VKRVRTSHHRHRAVSRQSPGKTRPVTETRIESHFQRNLALEPFDDPHHVAPIRVDRHEVDDAHDATVALCVRLQDHRLAAISLGAPAVGLRRANGPAPVLVAPEERGEARLRVEAGHAEPVDIAALRDQRGALRIPDQSVVFDERCHVCVLLTTFMTSFIPRG